MSYNAKAIANLMIDIAKQQGSSLDQMKLQKLVYITHGWNLAIQGEPLISDDIQAWQYGPVIPSLYNEFRNCGRDNITDYATDVQVTEDDLSFSFLPPKVDDGDAHTIDLANKVWEIYGKYTGPQLSNLTHMPGTPWDKVYKDTPRSTINNSLIKEHFISLSQNVNV